MRLMHPRVLIGCLAAAALAGCHTLAQQPAPLAAASALPSGAAQVIYLGGDIVTLNDAQPSAQPAGAAGALGMPRCTPTSCKFGSPWAPYSACRR